MTTIVYDGKGNVGADRRVSFGSLYNDQQQKLLRGADFIIAFAGAIHWALRHLRTYGPDFAHVTAEEVISNVDGWHNLLRQLDEAKGDIDALLFSVYKGQVMVMTLTTCGVWMMLPNDHIHSLGSGGAYAAGAVAAGASVSRAIALSSMFVHDVCPEADVIDIRKELGNGY